MGMTVGIRPLLRAPLALFLLAAASGCGGTGGPRPVADRDAGTGPFAAIRARSEATERLQASLELVWEDPATDEPEGCSAFLVYGRGEGLRVLARSVAFVTVFELVADRETAWLDVPREGVTVSGRPDDPGWDGLPASPGAFLVALLADPWAGKASAGPAEPSPEDPHLLRGEGWTLRLDPATGFPSSYRKEGLRIDWSDWAPRRGVPWPHEAEIRTSGGLLRARLGRLLVNRPGSPGQFDFRPNEDREILSPAEAGGRWKRALEGP